MSGTLTIVVITGVIALVFIRQFAAQRLSSEGKAWWLIPVVLTVMAVRQPGLVDPAHHVASAVLLGLEMLIGLACGAGWAWTTRIWTDEDGAVWTKGSWAAAGGRRVARRHGTAGRSHGYRRGHGHPPGQRGHDALRCRNAAHPGRRHHLAGPGRAADVPCPCRGLSPRARRGRDRSAAELLDELALAGIAVP